MPRVKQVARKIVIMEKFASLDAENRFEELYSERSILADLGLILTRYAPYPLPSDCRDAIRTLNWDSFCSQRIESDPQ